MRVACLVNLYPKISHSFIRREVRALEELGVEVVRFSVRRPDEPLVDEADVDESSKTKVLLEMGAELMKSFARVARRRPRALAKTIALATKTGVGSERGVALHMAYVVEACALLELFEKDPVDHVHAHFGTNAPAVAMYCESLGGPGFSFTAHGTDTFEDPEKKRVDLKAQRARFVACVCDWGRRELLNHAPHARSNDVHVVRCGLDEAFRDATPTPVTSNQLVIVARFSEEKGHRVLLDAAGRLKQQDVDFRLVLVGDGDLRGDIEAQIAALGLGHQIELAGWQDHEGVKKKLEASRALVLSSFGEGLPVVIMEAMAMGRPVVSTDVGGIAELVVDEQAGRSDASTGWLVPSRDPERLAEALRAALEMPDDEMTAMGLRGRQRVLTMHDVRTEAAKLKALFERYARD